MNEGHAVVANLFINLNLVSKIFLKVKVKPVCYKMPFMAEKACNKNVIGKSKFISENSIYLNNFN